MLNSNTKCWPLELDIHWIKEEEGWIEFLIRRLLSANILWGGTIMNNILNLIRIIYKEQVDLFRYMATF